MTDTSINIAELKAHMDNLHQEFLIREENYAEYLRNYNTQLTTYAALLEKLIAYSIEQQ